MIGSCNTEPVKYSAGARRVGREAARWMSMEFSPFSERESDLGRWAKRKRAFAHPTNLSLLLCGGVARLGLGVHRIETGQRRTIVHLVDDPGFHSFLLGTFRQHVVKQGLRDQHRAVL